MKIVRNFVLLFIIICINANGDVLFFDSFEGTTVNSSNWTIVNAFENSEVNVQDGYVRSINRGILQTKEEFNYPYKITGSFRINNSWYDTANIILRSNTVFDFDGGSGVDGFTIAFWYNGNINTMKASSDGSEAAPQGNYFNALSMVAGDTYQFEILDNGIEIALKVNDQQIFTETSSLSGKKIGIYSRESNLGISGSADFFDLTVTSVPEPSTLSLLAVGLGGLAMMRRRLS